jgi:uncharacterized protein (DUF488 family)
MNPLFTVGHSMHSIEAFLNLLVKHRIQAIADVRSQPYSRHFPWFSRQPLEQSLKGEGIRYAFLGQELGARREERECYIENKVSYERIAATPAFAKGLDRLQKGLQKYRIALLCAEKEPLDCHRTILVARHAARFAEIVHILGDGRLETGQEAENRLLLRCAIDANENDMFRSREEMLAAAYTLRGSEIAYVESTPEENRL